MNNYCKCGKRIGRHSTECKACYQRRMAAVYAQAKAVVATGKCPDCGAPLRHNLALTGWYQCSQLGAEGFRADSNKPSCTFQCFTGE